MAGLRKVRVMFCVALAAGEAESCTRTVKFAVMAVLEFAVSTPAVVRLAPAGYLTLYTKDTVNSGLPPVDCSAVAQSGG